ncbi:hypothetical protein EON64_00355 [archaeon]|nr:MAG: hypothetical protein EON64_00355 [archaeon]
MIYMLELLPPYNVVVRSKWLKDNKTLRSDDANALQLQKRIRLATRGPDLYSMGDDRQDLQSEEDIIYPTLLLLKEDCIDLLSGLTGQVIQTVQLSHILSSSAMETTYRGSVAKDRQLSMVEKDLEGKVCVFHWCPYSTHLIVGFTTGLVGVVDFQQPVHSYQRSKPDFSYFRSNEVHTSEITLMKSFIFTKYAHFVDDPLHPENGKDIVVLLLGDASGVISLWQLSPLSSSKSPLLFTTQQHLGSLQYACLCSVPLGLITKEEDEMKNKARMIQFDHSASELKDSNHKILVTCCSNGRVYVWRVEKNLTLSLMAFFHSSTASSKAKVTSCLALPKMVYRKINVFKPKVITSSAASVESSAESKKADKEKWGARDKTVNTIPVANLYYEIYVLLGYGDGQLEVYNVSSDARYCTTEPIFSLRELQAPLISLVVCNTDSANGKTLEHDVQHQHPNCISSEFTLVNHPQDFLWDNPEESPYPNSAIENLLCGFEGGTVVAFELKINPFYALDEAVGHRLEVKRLNYQHIPIKLCNLLPLHRHSVVLKTLRVPSVISVWDYAYVGEFDVLQVLPYIPISKALPYKWRNEWRLKADGISNEGKAEANPFVLDECPVVLRDDTMLQAEFGKGEIDILEEYSQRSSQAMEEEASIESVQDNNSASLSHRGESVASLLSMSTASSAFYRDKKQYVGPMETMQRIISSDLYVAKKDRRLLEMFTQNADSNTFTIPADKVIEIVANWCNGIQNSQHTKATTVHEIRTENLKELFKLLDIQPSDEMRFVEVAKIAAITLSAVKKGMEIAINAPQPAIQQKMYKNLRKQMTKVSYNSMGERVVEKITLSNETMGLPTGTVALVKNALASFLETHRSAIQLIKSMPDNLVKSRRLLEKLPASLLKIISPIKLPVSKDKWCADHLHYFDELRTLVIARALFDMRSSSQFEAMQSRDIMKSGAHQVLSMPMLLIKYFERLYGECHVTMNVSRHKISNYLEACMQYTYFPLLNILKSSLYLDNMMINFSSSEVALWLINEARNLLISRGLVIAGNSLTAMDKGLMQDVNNASSVASRHACWLYITKSNATAICDELLRVRGQFGPHMYLSIMDIVNGIATVSSSDDDLALSTAHEVLHEGDIIDLEKFLEVLFYEYVRQNERIRSLRKRVFGEFSVNVASVAVSREINTQAESKRVTTPINDEIDAGFGSYHSTNLRKIQELLSFCMQHDALRTGQVGAEIMQQAFKTVLYDNHRVEDRGYEGDAYRAMLAVKNQMKIRSIEDQLSYIDVVAMLLAWEEHHQGFKLVSLPWLLASLPPIQRGIETSLAKDLVKLFSLVSSLNNVEDPVWVVRSTLASGSMQLDDSLFKTSALSSVANVPDSNPPTALSIPMEGNWKTGPVAVPADEPGLLLAQAISTVPSPVVHVRSAVQLPKYEEHRREIEHLVAPSVLETARSSATLTGEAVNPVFSTKKQASITVKKLDMEIPLPRSAYTPGYEVIDHGRQSFSRVMQRISMEGTESPTNTAKGLEIELRREIDLDPLPEPIFASVSTPGKEPERQTYDIGMSLDTFHSQFSDTESSNMLVEDSIGTMDSNYQQYDLSLVGDEIIPRNSQNVGNKMVGGSNSSQVLLTPFLDVKDQEKQRSQLSQVIQALQDDSVNVHDKSKLLADEVVSRRIEELQYVEEVFQTEFEQEKEEFEKRRLEKEALREKLRQEMLLKEKEAMKVYRKSLMERSERMKKARAHLSAMEEAEAEQRRQKEKDIQAILNRNRSRALNKLDERTSKEKSQALREREANEAILMKKEEKLSMRIELIIREEKRYITFPFSYKISMKRL